MPQNAPIVINDGTSDVTFSPDSSSSTHVQLQDLSEAVLAERGLLHFDRPSSEGSQIRRSIRINIPYVETDASGVEVMKMASFKGEFVSPTTAPKSVRTRLRVMASNGLLSSAAVAAVDNPEWFW